MTPSLLEHPLVKKYFSAPDDECWVTNIPYPEKEFMAYRILQAMEEPINKDDLVLGYWFTDSIWKISPAPTNKTEFHPSELRLPSQFQPEREKFCCDLHQHVPGVSEYPCTMKKPPSTAGCGCNRDHSSEPSCQVCHRKQSHCSCYEFRPETAGCPHYEYLNCGHKKPETPKCADHPDAIACCHDPKCKHPAHALERNHKPEPTKCEHGVEARMIYPCNECTLRVNNKDVAPEAEAGRPMLDVVEEQIEHIIWPGVNDEVRYPRLEMKKRLYELVAIVRGEK